MMNTERTEQADLPSSVSVAISFYKGLGELFQSPLKEAPSSSQEGPLLVPGPSSAALQEPEGFS